MANSYEDSIDWEIQVKEAAETTVSATAAAAKLGIKFCTYKKYATKYGCYYTNQSGKGLTKSKISGKIPLNEILEGKHPQYQTNKLRIRLLTEEIFKPICANCGLEKWLNQEIPLELDHIDGISNNHKIENLRLLCPNCHALTETYRGKNIKK